MKLIDALKTKKFIIRDIIKNELLNEKKNCMLVHQCYKKKQKKINPSDPECKLYNTCNKVVNFDKEEWLSCMKGCKLSIEDINSDDWNIIELKDNNID